MTQEEKAKAYDKALEKARKMYNSTYHPTEGHGGVCYNNADLETLFPELKESEDEKVIKEIISIVKSYRESCITEGNHRFDDCIAWLEKQGEQKPAWSEEDGIELYTIINFLKNPSTAKSCPTLRSNAIDWLKSLKDRVQPKQEWGEEDLYMQEQAIKCVNNSGKLEVSTEDIADWLKSLKPQPRWKPSEEQMNYLKKVYESYYFCDGERSALESLYNDLKKL